MTSEMVATVYIAIVKGAGSIMRRISNEEREKIIANNKKISELLVANEQILVEAGYDLPRENFAFDPVKERELKIQVPTRYIRTKGYYMKNYALMKICNKDEVAASNIAYSLEVSDFYNYIFNRFGIYGAILSMVYKQATINIVSIIEMLIKSYIKTLQKKCASCPCNEKCQGRIVNKNIVSPFKKQIDEYKRLQIFDWDEEKYEAIKDFYDYRNHIHITKATENEFTNRMHSIEQYNKAIELMKEIDASMKDQIDLFSKDCTCVRYCKKIANV